MCYQAKHNLIPDVKGTGRNHGKRGYLQLRWVQLAARLLGVEGVVFLVGLRSGRVMP